MTEEEPETNSMLNWIINCSLKSRLLVCVLAAGLIVVGGRALSILPIDAFPDTTPVQVQLNTTAPSLNPQETEAQITIPVELAISGLPGLQNVRSVSKFGLSQVVATFDDTVDVYRARQLITERLQTVELPEGLERRRKTKPSLQSMSLSGPLRLSGRSVEGRDPMPKPRRTIA